MAYLSLLVTLLALHSTSAYSQEFYDDPAGVRSFHQSRIGRTLLNRNADLAALLKNEAEVDTYMKCYLDQRLRNTSQADARQMEFNQNYKPFIQYAVQAFQVPYSLSACVMFRETFLDNDAVSHSGARTIAQFTGNTYETLKNHLRDTQRKMPAYQDFLKMQENPSFDILNSTDTNFFVKCHQFAQRDGPHYRQASSSEQSKGQRLCSAQLRDFEINKTLTGELQAYLNISSRGMDVTTRSRYFSTPMGQWPSGNDLLPPSSFNSLKNNPMWLSAMNIFYLKRMTMIADSNFNPQGFQRSDDYLGYLSVIAGSYNRGPAALNDAVSMPNGSIKKWCDRLKSSNETKNYMLSIKRCMAKGSNYAMTGMTDSEACKSQGPGVDNITDPCETLLVPGDGKVYDLTQPGEPVICDPAKGQDCSGHRSNQ